MIKNAYSVDSCRENLGLFCETYLPWTFGLPWTDDQRALVAALQGVILGGGTGRRDMDHGCGKTSIALAGVLWASLYGYHDYILVVTYLAAESVEMGEAFWAAMQTNDRLQEGFAHILKRDVCFYRSSRRIIFGDESRRIQFMGIGSSVEGISHKMPNGRVIRPSLCIIDSPHPEESLRSQTKWAEREHRIDNVIKCLGGIAGRYAAFRIDDVMSQPFTAE